MRRRRRRGQALLEFSLVLPIFLVMLMGVVDVGRAIWAQNSLAAAAREGARFAIVHGGSATTLCPVGRAGPDAVLPAAGTCSFPTSPSRQAIKDVVIANATAGGTTIDVHVCYGAGCTGDDDTVIGTAFANNSRSTPVTVRVTSRVNLITPAILGMNGFGIAGDSTMVVNH